MRATLLLRAQHAQAYQPMIRFLGSRKNIEYAPHAPAPHPAAPQAIKDDFQSFLSKLQSTSKGLDASSNPKGQSLESSARGEVKPSGKASSDKTEGPISSKEADFENFWEAPGYLWKIREMSERESEAVMPPRTIFTLNIISSDTGTSHSVPLTPPVTQNPFFVLPFVIAHISAGMGDNELHCAKATGKWYTEVSGVTIAPLSGRTVAAFCLAHLPSSKLHDDQYWRFDAITQAVAEVTYPSVSDSDRETGKKVWEAWLLGETLPPMPRHWQVALDVMLPEEAGAKTIREGWDALSNTFRTVKGDVWCSHG